MTLYREKDFSLVLSNLKQKWQSFDEKGDIFYKYFEEQKLYGIKECMSAEIRSMVGLGFPQKPYLQNGNECMNNVLNSAGSNKCKNISEVVERHRTVVKDQENQVVLFLLN